MLTTDHLDLLSLIEAMRRTGRPDVGGAPETSRSSDQLVAEWDPGRAPISGIERVIAARLLHSTNVDRREAKTSSWYRPIASTLVFVINAESSPTPSRSPPSHRLDQHRTDADEPVA